MSSGVTAPETRAIFSASSLDGLSNGSGQHHAKRSRGHEQRARGTVFNRKARDGSQPAANGYG